MQRFAKPSVAKAAHRFDPYTHRQIYGGSYVAYLSVLKTVKSVKRRRGSTPLASAKLAYGVTAALETLTLSVGVRIPVGQPSGSSKKANAQVCKTLRCRFDSDLPLQFRSTYVTGVSINVSEPKCLLGS